LPKFFTPFPLASTSKPVTLSSSQSRTLLVWLFLLKQRRNLLLRKITLRLMQQQHQLHLP